MFVTKSVEDNSPQKLQWQLSKSDTLSSTTPFFLLRLSCSALRLFCLYSLPFTLQTVMGCFNTCEFAMIHLIALNSVTIIFMRVCE